MSKDEKSYGQILKSSAMIGGSSVINIGLGIIRAKAMALILGQSGVGLMGFYSLVSELTRNVASMGLNTSGVRQIAEAVGSGQDERVARTVTTLRRIALLLGAAGALLMLLLAWPIARLSFGNGQHTGSLALLSLAVLFGTVSMGQMALVQGMRRIRDLAVLGVLASLFGTIFTIPLVYFLGERGVVWSLVCVALTGILTSWYYSRRIQVRSVAMSWREIRAEASILLNLGLVFMVTGLLGFGVPCLVRIIIIRGLGVDDAGAYHAAWVLGGMYVGVVLQAMGADFFPRLTAVAEQNSECNRLVNEQTEVSLLLAGPGVLATLTIPHLVIHAFYSGEFQAAVELLRWIGLGMLLRIVVWPMCYILVAKGEKKWYLWTEILGGALQLTLVLLGVACFGLNGTAIAFFASYLGWGVLVYFVVRSVSGFRWSRANLRLGCMYGTLVTLLFVSWYFLPRPASVILGLALTAGAGIHSGRRLSGLVPFHKFPKALQKLLTLFRLAPVQVCPNS